MVMTMLRRVVGEKRAFDLVATGRLVAAAEAQDIGLVSQVVPDARPRDRRHPRFSAAGLQQRLGHGADQAAVLRAGWPLL